MKFKFCQIFILLGLLLPIARGLLQTAHAQDDGYRDDTRTEESNEPAPLPKRRTPKNFKKKSVTPRTAVPVVETPPPVAKASFWLIFARPLFWISLLTGPASIYLAIKVFQMKRALKEKESAISEIDSANMISREERLELYKLQNDTVAEKKQNSALNDEIQKLRAHIAQLNDKIKDISHIPAVEKMRGVTDKAVLRLLDLEDQS